MRFFGTAVTDIGISKSTNQDSVCIKVAETDKYGQVAMVVLCDGMGGLQKGELASATVIRAFSNWFEKELPCKLNNYSWQSLAADWDRMAKEQSLIIGQYGKQLGITLGTTLTAMLFIEDKYLLIHVGDSRAYMIKDSLLQLTEDQTFVLREIKAGRMTIEEAAVHPKRNMLLQCIGASANVVPALATGNTENGAIYMLCSDGFRHVLSNDEIFQYLNPYSVANSNAMELNSKYLIDVVKSRNEKDNITVALLRCFE